MKVKQRIKELVRIKGTESRKEFLRLDMNENCDGLPESFVRRVFDKITAADLAMYPELFDLRKRLAEYNDVNEDNILILNGTDEGLKSLFEVFGEEGKELVTVYPTFEMYQVYANMYGMVTQKLMYDDELKVSVSDLVDMITDNTAIVAVLNPNNPIGNVYSENEVITIIERAKEKDSIVILDEAYYYYYSKSFVNLAMKYENVVLLRTFSKFCSIAGLRIGYMVASPELIKLTDKVRPSAGVNAMAARFALEILNDKDLIPDLMQKEKEGKEYLIRELTELGYSIFKGEGNYVLFKSHKSPEDVYNAMKERKILVKTYKAEVLKDYVRVTTSSKEIMNIFINNLKEVDLQ